MIEFFSMFGIFNILAFWPLVWSFFVSVVYASAVAYGAYLIQQLFVKKPKDRAGKIGSLPIQYCQKGNAIPKVYGCERLAGNIIWMGPQGWYEKKTHQPHVDGNPKVGTYYRSFLIGIAEGSGNISKIWMGKRLLWSASGGATGNIDSNEQVRSFGEAATSEPSAAPSYGRILMSKGDGTQDARFYTGENFGKYDDLIWCYFHQFENMPGSGGAIPNFVFEISTATVLKEYPTLRELTAPEIPAKPAEPALTALVGATSITDAAGLQAIAGAGHYQLANDINLTGVVWTPIVNFSGKLDGNGKTISNLSINAPASANQALFGTTLAGVEIYNLTLEDCTVIGKNLSSILVASFSAAGSIILRDITLNNCSVTGTWDVAPLMAWCYPYSADIRDCSANGCSVVSTDSAVGGLIAAIQFPTAATGSANVVDCDVVGGTINASSDAQQVGGFIGYSQGNTTPTPDSYVNFHSCSSSIDITAVDDVQQVGGFIGYAGRCFTAISCNATGDIDMTLAAVTSQAFGGFCGFNDALHESYLNCYSEGEITIDVNGGIIQLIGGFVGKCDANSSVEFLRCYSKNNITITGMIAATSWNGIGGFIGGFLEGAAGAILVGGTVERCWSEGDIIINHRGSPNATYYGGLGSFIGTMTHTGAAPVAYGSNLLNCYSWGSITMTDDAGSGGILAVTGFVGSNGLIGATGGMVVAATNCYDAQTDTAVGSGYTDQIPSDETYSKGFCGYSVPTSDVDVTACYWDTQTSGIDADEDEYADGHITDWMQTKANFVAAGWDLDDIWYMPVGTVTCEDVNPATIINDLAQNGRYGAGIAQAYINNDSVEEEFTYWASEELEISLALTEQMPLTDWIDYVLSHCDGYRFWSEGKLHIGAFKDEASIASLTQDDLVREEGQDPPPPVSFVKRKLSETFNRVNITWTDREHTYDAAIATQQDEVDQRVSGKLRTNAIELAGIHNATMAQKMAIRYIYNNMYRFTTYAFKVGYSQMLLMVGDVIDVTDGSFLVCQRMRIVSREEDVNGRFIAIEALEDIEGLYPTIEYDEPQQTEADPDTPVSASDLVSGSLAFREDLIEGMLYVSFAPGDDDTTGADIYRSYDGVNYEYVGRVILDWDVVSNSVGVTTSSLPRAKAIIHRHDESFTVNIGTVNSLRTDVTDDDFFANQSMARIDDEIIGWKSAESLGSGVWRITQTIRGMFGTEAVEHDSGAAFKTLSPIDFYYEFTDEVAGQKLYFKALSTHRGDVGQSLDDVTATEYTVQLEHDRPASISEQTVEDQSGIETVDSFPVVVSFNLASRIAGFNLGGKGEVGWGAFTKDSRIEGVNVTIKNLAGVQIGFEYLDLDGYHADDYELTVTETDRAGNDPVIIELEPVTSLPARKSTANMIDLV